MIALGIETSCDETSIGIVKNRYKILSLVTLSSLNLHRRFGGVVPEIAHRKHAQFIDLVYKQALKEANISSGDIDIIGVVKEPGLVGSLIVGVSFARTLSLCLDKPLIEVNHLHSHLYASFFNLPRPDFPFLGVVISGGHTNIFIVHNFLKIREIACTRDDACGEAFDKVAKILGLGFPGGPLIDKLAQQAGSTSFKFKGGAIKNSLDFSFSGLKTAIFYKVREILKSKKSLTLREKKEISLAFQRTIVSSIIGNIKEAVKRTRIRRVVLGGGVVANSLLRKEVLSLEKENINVFLPSVKLAQDNGAVVAGWATGVFESDFKCRNN